MKEVGKASENVLLSSKPFLGEKTVVGLNFEEDLTLEAFCSGFNGMGFQGTNLGRAVTEIKRMLSWRLSDEPFQEHENDYYRDLEIRKQTKCFVWLGFTSNLISSGLRDIFVFLAKYKLVDAIVTTAGGVEEDFVKVLGKSYIGDFNMKGKELRENGWNRIGNIIVPNDNYVRFESWVQPILDQMLIEQKEKNILWTPSKIIDRLGKEVNNSSSLFYWCHKNDIPVFCPGITDGSFGDNLFFHSYRNPGLVVDVVSDIRRINDIALKIKKSGVIILGGGLPKHHICNANLMRNGADFAVYISTAQEYDGSDSGARPDEAVSWGKIKGDAFPVKVHGDATIIFPVIVAATFKPYWKKNAS